MKYIVLYTVRQPTERSSKKGGFGKFVDEKDAASRRDNLAKVLKAMGAERLDGQQTTWTLEYTAKKAEEINKAIRSKMKNAGFPLEPKDVLDVEELK